MKVAIVTPYKGENYNILSRCHNSVLSQIYSNITHIFVADGNSHPYVTNLKNINHLISTSSHNDAGATPRSLGAISAFSLGFDAVAFLDADNTFEPNHISSMVDIYEKSSCSIVTATRNICDLHGNIMYVDNTESNGVDFCDTNCLFIGKPALHTLTYWVTDQSSRLWSDRIYWSAILHYNIPRSHCESPTVNYYSKWAAHYVNAGITPPDQSVWIDNNDGVLIHRKHNTI